MFDRIYQRRKILSFCNKKTHSCHARRRPSALSLRRVVPSSLLAHFSQKSYTRAPGATTVSLLACAGAWQQSCRGARTCALRLLRGQDAAVQVHERNLHAKRARHYNRATRALMHKTSTNRHLASNCSHLAPRLIQHARQSKTARPLAPPDGSPCTCEKAGCIVTWLTASARCCRAISSSICLPASRCVS